MGDILKRRREETTQRITSLRNDLSKAEELADGKACVYATGSFARGEASPYSDLDLFIVGHFKDGRRLLRRLDEICMKADLIEATKSHGIPDFSGDGEYLEHYTTDELIRTLGKPEDDVNNTFTARLLLLLESAPLLGSTVYDDVIGEVIAAYWEDFEDHKNEFMPAFLANDILRLWRTFCVNYEARTAREPQEKKAKRKLKNYKLKHSRLLTCYSALLHLLATYTERKTVSPTDALEMVRLTPTQRLEKLLSHPETTAAQAKIADLLGCYERFLDNTNEAEDALVARFLDPARSRAYLGAAHEFGDTMFEVLEMIGKKSRFYRLLVV